MTVASDSREAPTGIRGQLSMDAVIMRGFEQTFGRTILETYGLWGARVEP